LFPPCLVSSLAVRNQRRTAIIIVELRLLARNGQGFRSAPPQLLSPLGSTHHSSSDISGAASTGRASRSCGTCTFTIQTSPLAVRCLCGEILSYELYISYIETIVPDSSRSRGTPTHSAIIGLKANSDLVTKRL
jgi:hypothetical protein